MRNGVGVTAPVLSDGAATYTPGVGERRGSTTKHYGADLKNEVAQVSTMQTISASKQYDAFGNVVTSSGTWNGQSSYGGKFGYQGDADTSLMLLGHRYYDSTTGRFVTRDPIRSGRNWFGYVRHNPVKYSDPTGLQVWYEGIEAGAGYGVGGGFSSGVYPNELDGDWNYEFAVHIGLYTPTVYGGMSGGYSSSMPDSFGWSTGVSGGGLAVSYPMYGDGMSGSVGYYTPGVSSDLKFGIILKKRDLEIFQLAGRAASDILSQAVFPHPEAFQDDGPDFGFPRTAGEVFQSFIRMLR